VEQRDAFFLGGDWVKPAGADVIDVIDPTTEEVAGRVPAGTAEDVDRAVRAAQQALPGWSALPPAERAGHLAALRDGLRARAGDFATTIATEMGAPAKVAKQVQVGLPLSVLGALLDLLPDFPFEERIGNSLVVREPAGVVGAITPWNYPLHQVIAKIGPALAAGCTVVLKPSEVTPLTAYLLADVIAAAGLPAGVVNIVAGTGVEVGEPLAAHPGIDMISFTGSTRAGRRVAELGANTVKKVALELGGKSANVLLPDADFAVAVKVGVANAYLNSGQTCTAQTRMLVPAERHDEAVELAVAAAGRYTPGPPFEETTRLGPLVSESQRTRVRGYVEKGIAEGATLATGGVEAPLDRGYFVAPTVFGDVTPAMTIAREEIFGPVLAVLPYSSEEEAAAIANDSVYGLAGGVWSADPERAVAFARRIRTGQVDVNGARFNPAAPFGGYKQSGVGRELGRYGVEEFTELKSIQLP
jgi:aldehyde dehydrogenase (NAD+)